MDRMAGSRRRDVPNSSAIRTFRQRRACHPRPSQPTEPISDRLLVRNRLFAFGTAEESTESTADGGGETGSGDEAPEFAVALRVVR